MTYDIIKNHQRGPWAFQGKRCLTSTASPLVNNHTMSDSTNHFKISLAQRQTIITESGLCTGQINILVYLDKNIILHNIFEQLMILQQFVHQNFLYLLSNKFFMMQTLCHTCTGQVMLILSYVTVQIISSSVICMSQRFIPEASRQIAI